MKYVDVFFQNSASLHNVLHVLRSAAKMESSAMDMLAPQGKGLQWKISMIQGLMEWMAR